jgi:hypothetical protein
LFLSQIYSNEWVNVECCPFFNAIWFFFSLSLKQCLHVYLVIYFLPLFFKWTSWLKFGFWLVNATERDNINCDACTTEKASVECEDCGTFLCQKCNGTIHAMGKYKTHKVGALGSKKKLTKCSKHEKEEDMWCENDSVALCIYCVQVFDKTRFKRNTLSHFSFYPHFLTLLFSLILTHSISHSHSFSYPLLFSLILTHSHSFSYSLSFSLTLSFSYFLSHSLILSHSISHSHSFSHSISHSHTLLFSHSVSHFSFTLSFFQSLTSLTHSHSHIH